MPEYHKESGRPLNEIVEEQEGYDAPEIHINSENQTLERRMVRRTRTTRSIYSEAKDSLLSCPDGEHIWYMHNRSTFDAGCMKCSKHRFLNPTNHTIREGHIVDRKTGVILD